MNSSFKIPPNTKTSTNSSTENFSLMSVQLNNATILTESCLPQTPVPSSSPSRKRQHIGSKYVSHHVNIDQGDEFTTGRLIGDDKLAASYNQLAIFRLAPQDYHRFHAPADAVVGKKKDITGNLYT